MAAPAKLFGDTDYQLTTQCQIIGRDLGDCRLPLERMRAKRVDTYALDSLHRLTDEIAIRHDGMSISNIPPHLTDPDRS
jgi:hypothetical protein